MATTSSSGTPHTHGTSCRWSVHHRAASSGGRNAGPDPGNGDGKAVTAVPRRHDDERERPDGGAVRRREAGVRRRQGRRVGAGRLPGADGVAEPRHGGERVAGS